METTSTAPMSGRKAQAARNDQVILDAARAVFVADPGAPIAAVAERAGVGISALYRRYAGKEDLLRRLCSDGLKIYIAEAEAALADESDPWNAFTGFIRRIVDADVHSLTVNLAGTFTPDEDLHRAAARASELSVQVFDRAAQAGALRPGLDVADMSMIFELLAAVQLGDGERTAQLRHRYLALILDALHLTSAPSPPGPPPSTEEVTRRWRV
ncbi:MULTISPECIES: TetR/AcrR family transcriptional regulator [Streptosporangium]|uniref:AcrR family transcriptional regulator n=1 Tax=Streptosporangium brasiliense TaxID=47480 RepID=A0ABT9RAL2_9ACTN|nr:TetR/AcrR family transcriptional regulator [Streptosporangium brasiliense]MDP9866296.1 AcrR family transcriptional regulator [Streptosporangium brasiliense]